MSGFDLIASSLKYRAVLDKTNLVAKADSAVSIQGGTSTGKVAISQASHGRQNRSVSVNRAAQAVEARSLSSPLRR